MSGIPRAMTDEHSCRTEGFLSVVVPNYGRDGMRPFTKCGVHLFERSGFRRLTVDEVERRFPVVDSFVDLRS